MPHSPESSLLRFGCPACGVRLVVDQAIAGTEGPCPSCGARIIAPPLDVSRSLVERQASAVSIKPRGVSAGSAPAPSPGSMPARRIVEPAAPKSELPEKPVRRPRSVSPTTALSEKHTEQKNLKAFIKMLLAAIVVVGIALAVYYYLKQAS